MVVVVVVVVVGLQYSCVWTVLCLFCILSELRSVCIITFNIFLLLHGDRKGIPPIKSLLQQLPKIFVGETIGQLTLTCGYYHGTAGSLTKTKVRKAYVVLLSMHYERLSVQYFWVVGCPLWCQLGNDSFLSLSTHQLQWEETCCVMYRSWKVQTKVLLVTLLGQ